MKNFFSKRTFIILSTCFYCACQTLPEKEENSAIVKTYGDTDSFTISVSKDNITTAENTKLQITLKAPEDVTITPPKIDQTIGNFSIENKFESVPHLKDGNIILEFSYELSPYLAGDYEIPALTAQFKRGNDTKDISTLPQKITVSSTLTDQDLALKDIFGFHKITAKNLYLIIIITSCFIFSLIGFLIYKSKRTKHSLPSLSPKELALKELNELDEKQLPQKGEFKAFYMNLSTILRSFIERQYQISAPERTTEEFLPELFSNPLFEESQKMLLKEFLQQSDLVKFAKLIPEMKDTDKAFKVCQEFIMTEPLSTLEDTAKEAQ